MIMFGGSPIIVAVPPILPNRAKLIRYSFGFTSTALHNEMTTGAISSIVVTLSRKAESTASKTHKRINSLPGRCLLIPKTLTADHSNTPVSARIPTITIIPQSSESVGISIQVTISSNSGILCSAARKKITSPAPIMAARALWITSETINPKITMRRTSAIISWALPTGPKSCVSTRKPAGSMDVDVTLSIDSPPSKPSISNVISSSETSSSSRKYR
mmetsp:Transcript_12560/g.45823  ORF Transcript_12560/g.45823 Transcript_12560/m.45823 type:complete len:217 (-) Transcript_12560:1186-1836(-)